MEKIDSTEAMLAGIIEQADSQGKQIALISKTMGQIANDVEQLVEALDSHPAQQEAQSVITLKDHEEKIKTIKANMQKLYEQYLSLQKRYKTLQDDKRYWATQQWAKHLFRWMFLKRHLRIWTIYAIYNIILFVFMYCNSKQNIEINKYQESDIKYRYLKATGIAPKTIQNLEDVFERDDHGKVKLIINTIDEYEDASRHKSDSIIRTEQKKMENLK